jgi:hypothetical protein
MEQQKGIKDIVHERQRFCIFLFSITGSIGSIGTGRYKSFLCPRQMVTFRYPKFV